MEYTHQELALKRRKLALEYKENMKICKIKGCDNKQIQDELCAKHRSQIWRYGKILERTIKDKNEVIDCGDYCEICLYNVKCEEVAIAIIDKDDFERVKEHKWGLKDNYVRATINNKSIKLHQLVLGKKKNYIIDHKDTNTLNNRKHNLRHCSYSQNSMNKKNVKGYFWDNTKNRWCVKIGIGNKQIHIGYFTKEKDAIKARKKVEQKYFKEFAYNK